MVIFLLGNISLLSLVSKILKLYLRMCADRSDVACVHHSIPGMIPLLFTALYLAGYSFHPNLLFVRFRLKYSVSSLPKDKFYLVALYMWVFQPYGLCHLVKGLED